MRAAKELVLDLAHLFEDSELLEEVWSELDPYYKFSPELTRKLHRRFGFDDSE